MVNAIKIKLARVTKEKSDIDEVNGFRTLDSHADIPVSALLMALPSTITQPIKVIVVMLVVLVAVLKSVIGLPFTRMIQSRAIAIIKGALLPQAL